MLSRVAEAFFWIGRYLERAEGTARIVETVVQQTTGQEGELARTAAARLLAVMGFAPQPDAELADVVQRLAHDRNSRSSITGALVAARENARTVRHVLPADAWEALNVAYVELGLRGRSRSAAGLNRFLAQVRARTAAINGLTGTIMSRDDDWLFLTLGQALEGADIVTRQLGVSDICTADERGLVTVLQSCGGYEPYLRHARGVVSAVQVANFLLRDADFPRSALASLTVARGCLSRLAGPRREPAEMPWRLLGRACADLEFAAPDELLVGLTGRLTQLQSACSQISDAIAQHHFSYEMPTQWRMESAG